MPIEMPKGLPFSVDTFSPSSKRKRHHFLTHAHKDHTFAISSHFSYPIYSTHLTKSLVLINYPQLDDSLFVGIEVGKSIVIDDPDGEFRVTACDANHCPGGVMFLFEGSFGNVLHTGDCRLTPECLQNLPDKYIGRKGKEPQCRIDYVFLDCTFGKFSRNLPSKHSAIRQVINCIWKHPNAPVVHLTCDLLGQEEILTSVCTTFGSKIYVDKGSNPDFFRSLSIIAPEIISEDPTSRFQLFDGFPKLSERATAMLAEAQANSQHGPLILRPSAMWYVCEEERLEMDNRRKIRFNEAIKDQFGVWHVCYSMHSSREELEWALKLLAPKRVVSTTPSCRAMELDYVRKHCFSSHASSDDSLWKLLDIDVEACPPVNSPTKTVACSPMVEVPAQTCAESELRPVIVSPCRKKLLTLSPPSKRPPVTLFGRARLTLHDPNFPLEEKSVFTSDNPLGAVNEMKQVNIIQNTNEYSENRLENKLEADDSALQCKKLVTTESSEKILEKKLDDDSALQCKKLVTTESSEKILEKKLDDDSALQCKKLVTTESSEKILEKKLDAIDILMQSEEMTWETYHETTMQCEKQTKKETNNKCSYSVGSSKGYSDNIRKLYRSMHAPVPKPLPSLVELRNAIKQSRRI